MAMIARHGGPDPIQGYDCQVWVEDQTRASGGTIDSNMILLGDFTSIVFTIRNSTEPYQELNQRIARMLDGDIQMAWVMEKGMLDIAVLKQTFGFQALGRNVRFNRSPRFKITFSINDLGSLDPTIAYGPTAIPGAARTTKGRFVFHWCKCDSMHMAATSGKQVVANQWQGVAEGFEILTDALQPDSTADGRYLVDSSTDRTLT